MRLPTLLMIAAACVLPLTGCDDERDIFANSSTVQADPDSQAVSAEIAALALEAKAKDDPEAAVACDEAMHKLMQRGAKVETRIIDALRSSEDPYIRLGCVQVLNTIATSTASIPHLIAVLDDKFPLVARHADIGLRQLCQVRMIPESGQPPKDGVPALRERRADEVDLAAEERIWAEWHAANKDALKAAWGAWWAANKDGYKLPR